MNKWIDWQAWKGGMAALIFGGATLAIFFFISLFIGTIILFLASLVFSFEIDPYIPIAGAVVALLMIPELFANDILPAMVELAKGDDRGIP